MEQPIATVALAFTLSACGPQVLVPGDESTTAASTGPTTTSTATTTSATTDVTSVGPGPITDDGPAMTSHVTTLDGTTDPCAFECAPDLYEPFACDTFAQDCPAGEKCVPWADDGSGSWNATRCTPIAPDPAAVGEPCTVVGNATSGFDDCELGSLCFGVDEQTLQGTCVGQCGGTQRDPTCPDAQVCWDSNNGALDVCLQACHPLMAACPEGTGCLSDGDPFGCFPTTGDGVYNDNCEILSDCSPGHVCSGNLPMCPGSCCTLFCDLTMPDCPNALQGVTCEPWFSAGAAPPGYENVGSCEW